MSTICGGSGLSARPVNGYRRGLNRCCNTGRLDCPGSCESNSDPLRLPGTPSPRPVHLPGPWMAISDTLWLSIPVAPSKLAPGAPKTALRAPISLRIRAIGLVRYEESGRSIDAPHLRHPRLSNLEDVDRWASSWLPGLRGNTSKIADQGPARQRGQANPEKIECHAHGACEIIREFVCLRTRCVHADASAFNCGGSAGKPTAHRCSQQRLSTLR